MLEFLAVHLADSAYLGLFLILAVGGLGLPIPEELTLVAAGLFVSWGLTELWLTLLVCAAGMAIGDFIYFWIGRRFGQQPLHGLLGRLVPPDRVAHWLARVRRSGLLVVFFGRYLTGVRPAVFLAAGAANIPASRFVVVDAASALISLSLWVFLGLKYSAWIEMALYSVRSAEAQILGVILAVVLVLFGEWWWIRSGWLDASSSTARVVRALRIPMIVLIAILAILVAHQHHIARRGRLVAAVQSATPVEVEELGALFQVIPRIQGSVGRVDVVLIGPAEQLQKSLAAMSYRRARVLPVTMLGRMADVHVEQDAGLALSLWRSPYLIKGAVVWFGRFVESMDRAEMAKFGDELMRVGATFRTSVGPRIDSSRRRVLAAVLRERPHGLAAAPEVPERGILPGDERR